MSVKNKIQNFLQNIKNSLNKNIEIVIGGDGMIELEPNLIFLLQLCSKYKFRTILASNGYLINRNLLFRLHKSGLDSLSFSLDYITAEKHDKQRGVKNSFSHIISLIDFVNQHNIKLGIGINCVIMKSNIDEIIPLAKWCISKNIVINFQAISQPFNTSEEHNWFKQKKYQHLWPGNQKKVYKLLDDLINLKKQNFNC